LLETVVPVLDPLRVPLKFLNQITGITTDVTGSVILLITILPERIEKLVEIVEGV
jgi:hypothetical protein